MAPIVLRTVKQVRQWRHALMLAQKSVGFVPTMGALHDGHTLLVRQSLKENDHTIVLIFVNPLQFGPTEDLDAYPRTLETDLSILESNKVDAVFVPKVLEMYPRGIVLEVDKQIGTFVEVKGCSHQLEGSIRPQFFRGVATVVCKLLNVVTPTQVYFGQKDAQQCVVVKNMVRDLLMDVEVRILPTQREALGLAMSLRNAYLLEETRETLKVINEALVAATGLWENNKKNRVVQASEITEAIRSVLVAIPNFTVEYIACSHPESLDDLVEIDPEVGALVSTAVRVPRESGGEARLIDNVILL